MKLFEGKSPAERNKIIAASVLGVLAIAALSYSIILPMLFGGRKTTVTVSSSPSPTASPNRNTPTASRMPTIDEQNGIYVTTPVRYEPGAYYAPDAGRNIFAFYEPPPPTPYSPTPTPLPKTPEMPIATPTPTPPIMIGFVTPQSVYAGQQTFRLEVNGDKFTPEAQIQLNGAPLPTTFISPQKLVAEVPSNFISGAGSLIITVRTPDPALYSNPVSINVQAPPTPQFKYIGMIARQRFNNDTAYFEEQGKNLPISARLNDVLAGRFRLMSISASETVFEDVSLGFKHRVALTRPQAGQGGTTNPGPNNPTLPNGGRTMPRGINPNPNSPNVNPYPNQTLNPQNPNQPCPPGIPCETIPMYQPTPPPQQKNEKDEDDDGR